MFKRVLLVVMVLAALVAPAAAAQYNTVFPNSSNPMTGTDVDNKGSSTVGMATPGYEGSGDYYVDCSSIQAGGAAHAYTYETVTAITSGQYCLGSVRVKDAGSTITANHYSTLVLFAHDTSVECAIQLKYVSGKSWKVSALINGTNYDGTSTFDLTNWTKIAWQIQFHASAGLFMIKGPSTVEVNVGGKDTMPNSGGCNKVEFGSSCPVADTSVDMRIDDVVIDDGPFVTTTGALPGGTTGAAYSQAVAESGGYSTLSWSTSNGSLPGGLSINSSTGVISGTPTATGTFSFDANCADTWGISGAQTLSIIITAGSPPTITTSSLPADTINISYNQSLAATGGTSPYSWSVSLGGLPAGLSCSSGGSISGTPTASGTANFTVLCTDNASQTATKALSITINAAPAITISDLPADTVGIDYEVPVYAAGGTSPLAWSISSGSLPMGLSIVSGTGVITGTPTVSGTSNFTVAVTDNVGASVTKAFSILIYPAPAIDSTTLYEAETTWAYSQTLSVTGGYPPYSWDVAAGSLPAGLSLGSSTGTISGTPTAAGTSAFTVRVADSINATITRALSIVTYDGLTWNPNPYLVGN